MILITKYMYNEYFVSMRNSVELKYDIGINFVEKTAETCVIRLMVVIGRGEKCNIYHLSFARSWIQCTMIYGFADGAEKPKNLAANQYGYKFLFKLC